MSISMFMPYYSLANDSHAISTSTPNSHRFFLIQPVSPIYVQSE